MTTGRADGQGVVRVRGFEVRNRDIFAVVMLVAVVGFLVYMAVAYGRASCASSQPAQPGAPTGSVKTAVVPASFAIGEKLQGAPPLRGVTREWAQAGAHAGAPPLRGVTREWAGASDISDAFAGVRRKVIQPDEQYAERADAKDIATAFSGVRRKVEGLVTEADRARMNLPRMLRGALGRERLVASSAASSPQTGSPQTGRMLDAGAKPLIEPPRGVQPGTLRLAEPGEERVPPLYDLKFGYLSNGPQAGERAERAQAESEGDGSVFEGWQGGHEIKSGISADTWAGDKDWSAKKAEVRGPMEKVCKLFDDMFNSQIAPGAETERVNDTDFRVKSNGSCVDAGRYYEFAGATIAAQMGARDVSLPAWAERSAVTLGLDNLKESLPGLRAAVLVDCADAPSYRLGPDGVVLNAATGAPVSFQVPWPADDSVLLTHSMKL